MDGALLVLALCLKAGLLTDAVGCSQRADGCSLDAAKGIQPGERSPSGPLWDGNGKQSARVQRVRRQLDYYHKKKKPSRTGAYSTSNITWNPEWIKAAPTSSTKGHMDKFLSRPKPPSSQGITPLKVHPEHPILPDMETGHLLGQKKKPRRKARIGSYSLLVNKQNEPLQVTRVRRQVKDGKKKKPKQPGMLSPLAETSPGQVQRPKQVRKRDPSGGRKKRAA